MLRNLWARIRGLFARKPDPASAEPLIYTSKGNLPIASLKLSTQWDFSKEYVKLIERYTDANGEVVRESAHVFHYAGLAAEAVAGSFGG